MMRPPPRGADHKVVCWNCSNTVSCRNCFLEGVSAVGLELIVASYGVPYALLLVVGGRLGDAFRRRRLLVAGVLAFIVASAACALAPSAVALVSLRAIADTVTTDGTPTAHGRATWHP